MIAKKINLLALGLAVLPACSRTPQSAIDNAYCQEMVRQAEHGTSTMAAGMQALAAAQPGAVTGAAAAAVEATAPAIHRQQYLNCMNDRGYGAAEAAAIGHLTP